MIGELSVLNEWIPEQMEPGTIFVLENAGEIGDSDKVNWHRARLERQCAIGRRLCGEA